jgi:hypothetical protein
MRETYRYWEEIPCVGLSSVSAGGNDAAGNAISILGRAVPLWHLRATSYSFAPVRAERGGRDRIR